MTTTEVHSVLERASRADIRYDPFVHVVLEDCLPEAYYRDLAASYPTDDTVVAMNKHSGRVLRPNQRNDILAHRALDCLLYTSPSPRDQRGSRMPSSA